jgi:hypothetical protein
MRTSIRAGRRWRILPRPDDRGTGTSSSPFWFLLKEHAVFLASSDRATGCSRPCIQKAIKTNQCSCCRIISWSYRRIYTIGRNATDTIMDRLGGVYFYILRCCSPSRTWPLSAILRQRYNKSATGPYICNTAGVPRMMIMMVQRQQHRRHHCRRRQTALRGDG